jgi:hypothetical protein
MNRLGDAHPQIVSCALSAGLLVLGVVVSCSSSSSLPIHSPQDGAAAGGATASSTGGVVNAMGGVAGNATAASGNGTGGAGSTGGTSTVVKVCANMKTLTAPMLTDFESYDGKSAASSWAFSFNGVWPDALYAGLYPSEDGTGNYSLGFVSGANGSSWAIDASNTSQATAWGGGLGLWMNCIDASLYSGVSFYARGSTPSGSISVAIGMEDTTPPSPTNQAGGGTCTISPPSTGCQQPLAKVALSADWTLIQIPWASFTGGMGLAGSPVAATGARIVSLGIAAQYNWQDLNGTGTWTPVPAPFDIQIDNLGFY